MSAEELDKPIPKGTRIPEGLELALRRLAKITVERGLDPVQAAVRLAWFLEAWSKLTPEQREAIRGELRRRRVPRAAQKRKPRRYGEQP